MSDGTFLYLVQHEGQSSVRKFLKTKWFWIYAGAVLLLAAAALTVWGGAAQFQARYLFSFTFILPYFTAMLAFRTLLREWKNGTVGWWITLPYPRARLLSAKLVAAFLQALALYAAYFAFITLLILYNAGIHGLGASSLSDLWVTESIFIVMLLGIAPFMLTLGLLLGAVTQSNWSPATPLLWMVFGLSGNALSWLTGAVFSQQPGTAAFDAVPRWGYAMLPVYWAAAALCFLGAVRVLSRHLKF